MLIRFPDIQMYTGERHEAGREGHVHLGPKLICILFLTSRSIFTGNVTQKSAVLEGLELRWPKASARLQGEMLCPSLLMLP